MMRSVPKPLKPRRIGQTTQQRGERKVTTYRTLLPLFDTLEGLRVTVRPYKVEDAEALRAAVDESREHVRPWLPFADAHRTIEESRNWIIQGMASWLLREDLPLSVWERDADTYLGGIGLHPHNWDTGYFEIGYWLRVSAQGQGSIAEAARLVTDFALDRLHANRVEIRCDARNRRSAAVAERLGFTREALLRNHARANDGTLRDTLIFALTPTDARPWHAS
jgi:RimJ/RimL family protein N-acetyltransferase